MENTGTSNIVERAIDLAGGPRMVAMALGLSRQAVDKWIAQGHLPRTEWTGETDYAGSLELMTDFAVTRYDLLEAKPVRNGPRQTAGGRPRKNPAP